MRLADAIPPGMSRERAAELVRTLATVHGPLLMFSLGQHDRRRGNTWGMWRASR